MDDSTNKKTDNSLFDGDRKGGGGVGTEKYTVGSLFAGIGGICIGFNQAGCDVKWANEIDKYACYTYRKNSDIIGKNTLIFECDICDFHPNPCDRIDILTGGFPCQPYSQAGNKKGLQDSRSLPMFKQMLRIAKECKPRIIFMENVSVLKTIDDGKVFDKLMALLSAAGFKHYPYYILNSKDYSGIAQFRNRIYVVAFKNKADYDSFINKIGNGIEKIPIEKNIGTIVDLKKKAEDKYYYSRSDRNKSTSIRYDEHFEKEVKKKNVIYQYRRTKMRENKNDLCPALTASMGLGGHNVPIIRDKYGIRKLTPSECLQFQGFPEDFKFPDNVCDSQKYKQVGNSVTIPVIYRLASIIVESLQDADQKKE